MQDSLTEVITPAAWRLCECPVHHIMLVRMSSGWVCSRGMGCYPLTSDTLLLERMRPHLRLVGTEEQQKTQLKRVLKKLRRVSAAKASGE